jgi:hypothetical protein
MVTPALVAGIQIFVIEKQTRMIRSLGLREFRSAKRRKSGKPDHDEVKGRSNS